MNAVLDADPPPMDGKRAADLANHLLECCRDAELNRFEIITALGLVAGAAFQDVPKDYLEGWIATLRKCADA